MRKTIFENHRVEVYPERPWLHKATHEAMTGKAEALETAIKRHVDDIREIYVESDARDICEFCEDDWDMYPNGCPACCTKAMDEWEEQNPKCKDCIIFDECKTTSDCQKVAGPDQADKSAE